MVDRVLDGYIREFATDFGFVNTPTSLQFECFVNYLLVKRSYPGILDPEQLSTGEAAGIDGIAIFVNDRLVTSPEDVDFFKNAHVRLRFVFVQSKTTPNLDMGDMGKFLYAVEDFFRSSPLIPVHEGIAEYRKLHQHIYDTIIPSAAPTIELYYVTTGAWQDDPTLRGFILSSIDRLKSMDLFEEVIFEPIGGHKIKDVYRAYKKSIERTILFHEYTTLPKIADVEQAFIGILSCGELLKLISDNDGNLLRSVFYENVRDYQGDNRVNEDIRQTVLGIINQRDKFVLLNNGVTIVAKSTTPVGREMILRDYQIVNGCQTSHILYFNKGQLSDNSILVPVKLIATKSQELTNSIVKASNWQTEIKPEAFEALEPFHRALQEFYVHASPLAPKLYYERRSKQYLNIGVPDSHVIQIAYQTTSFVGMFIEEPHHSNDMHYSKLLEKYREDKRPIFAEEHDPYPYFLSGFSFYLARSLLRTYKRFIYHMLLSFRIRVGGLVSLTHGFRSSKKLTDLCDRLKRVLEQRDVALEVFRETARDIDRALEKQESAQHDIHKRKYFTTDLISVICPSAYSALVQVSPKNMPPRRPQGIVTRFGWRGFGFISDEEGNNIFAHGSEVRGKRFCELKQGQRVEFTPVYMDKGFVATDVVFLDEGK